MNLPDMTNEIRDSVSGLPMPDKDALSHSRKLLDCIRQAIASADGKITFQRYMEMALYEPGLGYYSAGAGKFGPQGDFVTAPEVSSLFSRCIARQCEEILDGIQSSVILELGAGTGRMACEILRELGDRACLPERYLILEVSADLRERQRKLLTREVPEFVSTVDWLDRLPDRPIEGIILANEVVDALPVRRFSIDGSDVFELNVAINNNKLYFIGAEADDELRQFAHVVKENWEGAGPEVYTTEINSGLSGWLTSLANVLKHGVMLFIDYGYTHHEYYHPQRTEGSLLCHYRHRVHSDPFFLPGLQDITASVDFTALAEAAVQSSLDVKGYTTQAHFLMATGLTDMLDEEAEGTDEYLKLSQQVKRLTLPDEMGERFKVMALTRQYDRPLMGFGISDQRARL